MISGYGAQYRTGNHLWWVEGIATTYPSWNQIVLAWSQASGLAMFVNGDPVGADTSGTNGVYNLNNSSKSFVIGMDNELANPAKNHIDELMFWDTVFDNAMARTNFLMSLTQKVKQGHYHL